MGGKKNLFIRSILLIAPVLAVAAAFILKEPIIQWAQRFPQCPFYRLFHLYCPACGNTRSILALLRLDVAESLRYNAMPLLLLVLGGLFYVELICRAFGKRVRLVPRHNAFLFGCIGALLIYFVVRNFWV